MVEGTGIEPVLPAYQTSFLTLVLTIKRTFLIPRRTFLLVKQHLTGYSRSRAESLAGMVARRTFKAGDLEAIQTLIFTVSMAS
jgi:hypothetical protein